MMYSVEEKGGVRRTSFKLLQQQRDMLADDGGSSGSLRKKLMQQIKRVAHHSRSDLKLSTADLESARKEQYSLKQASSAYQEMLLTRSCQLVDPQKNRLISGTNAEGFLFFPKAFGGEGE